MSLRVTGIGCGVLLVLAACGSQPAAPPAPGTAASSSPAASTAASAKPAASGAAGAPVSGKPAPVIVRVATQHVTGNAGIYIARDKGYFAQQGLDVRYVDAGATDQMIPPLATGTVDAITVGIISSVLNAMVRIPEIKIVADSGGASADPNNGFSAAFGLQISKQSAESGRIKDYKDLKGKIYGATSSGGSTAEIVLEKALNKGGLTLNDITSKLMTFADLPIAVSNGSIDFGGGPEPILSQGVAKGLWVRWKNGAEIYPGAQIAALYFGPHMTQLGSDVEKRFMVAYTQGLRDYNDAFGPRRKNRAEMVNILIKNTAVKDPAIYDRMTWNYMNPNCSINLQTFPNDLEWYATRGFTPKLDIAKVVDDSFCQAAVKQLGPYQP